MIYILHKNILNKQVIYLSQSCFLGLVTVVLALNCVSVSFLAGEGKATMTKAVGILQLPRAGDGEDVKPHTKCHVAGWGSTKKDACQMSNALREANVMIDRKYAMMPSTIILIQLLISV